MQTPQSRRVADAPAPAAVHLSLLQPPPEPAPPETELIELRQVAKRLAYEGMPLRLVQPPRAPVAEALARPAQVAPSGAPGAPQHRVNGCCLVDETVECDINREETGQWEIGMDSDNFLLQTRLHSLIQDVVELPGVTQELELTREVSAAEHSRRTTAPATVPAPPSPLHGMNAPKEAAQETALEMALETAKEAAQDAKVGIQPVPQPSSLVSRPGSTLYAVSAVPVAAAPAELGPVTPRVLRRTSTWEITLLFLIGLTCGWVLRGFGGW